MEEEYKTLETIFQIVKNDTHPDTYLCSPGEIILRQLQDWETTRRHLQTLAGEELVIIKQLDKIAVSITQKGIEKAKSLIISHQPAFTFSISHA